jgi:hypothetical protein
MPCTWLISCCCNLAARRETINFSVNLVVDHVRACAGKKKPHVQYCSYFLSLPLSLGQQTLVLLHQSLEPSANAAPQEASDRKWPALALRFSDRRNDGNAYRQTPSSRLISLESSRIGRQTATPTAGHHATPLVGCPAAAAASASCSFVPQRAPSSSIAANAKVPNARDPCMTSMCINHSEHTNNSADSMPNDH